MSAIAIHAHRVYIFAMGTKVGRRFWPHVLMSGWNATGFVYRLIALLGCDSLAERRSGDLTARWGLLSSLNDDKIKRFQASIFFWRIENFSDKESSFAPDGNEVRHDFDFSAERV